VNYNSPAQVVMPEIVRLSNAAWSWPDQRREARYHAADSVPSHCKLLKGAAEQMREYLANVAVQPRLFRCAQRHVAAYSDSAAIKDALVRQLYSPVRWLRPCWNSANRASPTMLNARRAVLAGLNKRIDTNSRHWRSMTAKR